MKNGQSPEIVRKSLQTGWSKQCQEKVAKMMKHIALRNPGIMFSRGRGCNFQGFQQVRTIIKDKIHEKEKWWKGR